ncbi:MAG: hypothetical protein H7336_05010 [Bacteriovorax sp.]|nr:hypothetical protein [Bacteriovorax sp.]
MSDNNSIKKVETLRNLYKAQTPYSSDEQVRELRKITNEIKVSNDLAAGGDEKVNSATGSPYLKDQPFYNKEVVLGSDKEADWREVKSYEEAKNEVLIFKNLRKLNII